MGPTGPVGFGCRSGTDGTSRPLRGRARIVNGSCRDPTPRRASGPTRRRSGGRGGSRPRPNPENGVPNPLSRRGGSTLAGVERAHETFRFLP
jgi:hypothetical protein